MKIDLMIKEFKLEHPVKKGTSGQKLEGSRKDS